MAFDKQPTLVPTTIGKITHILVDDPGDQGIRFVLMVLDQNSEVMNVRRGSEVPYLEAAQVTQLLNFADTQRPKIAALTIGTLDVVYHVLVDGDGSAGTRTIRYVARVIGAADLRGDEVPLTTAAQRTAITTFLDTQRAKAVSQILP